jgi:hypothetical protein
MARELLAAPAAGAADEDVPVAPPAEDVAELLLDPPAEDDEEELLLDPPQAATPRARTAVADMSESFEITILLLAADIGLPVRTEALSRPDVPLDPVLPGSECEERRWVG